MDTGRLEKLNKEPFNKAVSTVTTGNVIHFVTSTYEDAQAIAQAVAEVRESLQDTNITWMWVYIQGSDFTYDFPLGEPTEGGLTTPPFHGKNQTDH